MAGARDVGLHALVAAGLLVGFEGAGAQLGNHARGIHELAALRRRAREEFIIEPLVAEITLVVRDPLLKPPMRLNDELGHVSSVGFRLLSLSLPQSRAR